MSDWISQAADTVDRVVGTLRERTVVPVQAFAKALVYGLLAALIVVPATVLLVVGTITLLDNYLPGGVWVVYLLLGGIFVVAGAFCWAKRTPPASAPAS